MPSGFRLALALILVCGSCSSSLGDEPPQIPAALKPPAFDEFVVIPLRIHILSSSDLPDVNCGLTTADIQRILRKVNGIWHQAGIHWGLESLVFEPAAMQERFKKAIETEAVDRLTVYRMLSPEASKLSEGMNVYYIHRFAVNGVYLGDRMAFVQETAQLRPVLGGIDEPLPRVTAHELGHAVGLPHRQDRTNLLASGNNGTTLNEAEVARARDKARATPGALAVPELRKKADDALAQGKTLEGGKWLGWLAEIPGEGAVEARRRLDALSQVGKKDEARPASL